MGRRFGHSPAGDRRASVMVNNLTVSEPIGHHSLGAIIPLTSPKILNPDQETNNYKFLLDALVILLKYELDVLFYVFSNRCKSVVFTKMIESPILYLEQGARNLCLTIKNLPDKIETGKSTIYGLLSIIRWFQNSKTLCAKFYEVNWSS